MRPTFARTLVEMAEADDRVWLVIGDVGFGVVETFAQRFADRFLNVGVAEANLAGVSAGLALSGARPFMYSIGNFPTLRCLEQIRNDICYNAAPVVIVCVGGGLAYGSLGATHHATEDLAIMRTLPGMTVVAPADPTETELATRALLDLGTPAYLRLGRSGDPSVHDARPAFAIGRAITVRDGGDATIVATGAIVHTALEATEMLARQGVSARLLSMHTVKPIDREAVRAAAVETGAIVTVEEHSIVGGLGSAIAELVAEEGLRLRALRRLGLPDVFLHRIGRREHLLRTVGLDAQGIAGAVLDIVAPVRA